MEVCVGLEIFFIDSEEGILNPHWGLPSVFFAFGRYKQAYSIYKGAT